MKHFAHSCSAWLVAGSLVFTGAAQADFVVVDTFDQYNTGSLDGQITDWAHPLGNAFDNLISIDPANTGNQVLEVAPGSSTAQRIVLTIPAAQRIAIGDTGTLFFRVRVDGQIAGEIRDVRIGLNDQNPTTIATTGGHEAYVEVQDASNFVAFDGPTGGNGTQPLGAAIADEWYNVWMVVDAAALSYDVYMEGAGFTGQQLVADDFGFRNANNVNDPPQALSDALGTINLRPDKGNPTDAGTSSVWFDDFYIDPSSQNLTNPIPEPSSLAFGIVGALLLVRSRRRSV